MHGVPGAWPGPPAPLTETRFELGTFVAFSLGGWLGLGREKSLTK